MNELTERLLAEGYTKENHPDYVRWYDSMREFEYMPGYISKTVWEAPCGVQRKGEFTYGYMSYAGIDWRVENNNYNFHCPYYKKECKFFHPLLRDMKIGAKCSWHMTNKPYNYDNSAEKIEDERQTLTQKNLEKKFGHPSMIHCVCCHINEDTCEPYFKFDPWDCIRFTQNGCDNKICHCTGKERDLTLGNIYYDVKTTSEYRQGFVIEPVIRIEKGMKLFDDRKTITDLEMYLKTYPDAPIRKEEGKRKHSVPLFFAEYHGQKYELEILNVRIEKRESRDLFQDLADVREGIEVTHASDIIKANKQAKKERRVKAAEERYKRNWKLWVKTGDELYRIRLLKAGITEGELKEAREPAKIEPQKYEQMSMF